MPRSTPVIDHVQTMAEGKDAVFQCSGDVGEFGSVRLEVLNKVTNIYEHIQTESEPTVTKSSCMKHWTLQTTLTLSMDQHNGTLARCVTVYDDAVRDKNATLESDAWTVLVIPGMNFDILLPCNIFLVLIIDITKKVFCLMHSIRFM